VTEAEVRKEALETELSVAEAPAPRLLPNLGELYRAKVAALQDALEEADAAADRGSARVGGDAGFEVGVERGGGFGVGFAIQVGCGGAQPTILALGGACNT